MASFYPEQTRRCPPLIPLSNSDDDTDDSPVTLFIGEDREPFNASKVSLCTLSPAFRAAFMNTNFKEGITQQMYLPEEDPDTFKIIADFWAFGHTAVNLQDVLDIYGHAHRWMILKLQNEIVDKIRKYWCAELMHDMRQGEIEADDIPAQSQLRKFLVEQFAWTEATRELFFEHLAEGENRQYPQPFDFFPPSLPFMGDFYQDVQTSKAQLKQDLRPLWPVDLQKGPDSLRGCIYHEHEQIA